MKRCILGAGLLLFLLILSVTVTESAQRAPEDVSLAVHGAVRSAMEEDWETAAALAGTARAAWSDTRDLQSWLHHRDRVRDIDILFSQLRVYEQTRDREHFGEVGFNLEGLAAELAGEHFSRSPG